MSKYINVEWLLKESMPLSFSVQKWVNEVQIMTAPGIDIVRCKECRYWNTKGCRDGVGECEWAYYMTKPDDFCSYGEREGE